ncbi:hypothetical protein [Flavobacterium sp.]|jgi:hypothetical protein|uniref:hypothetical protein n=1 Tax=Flavobacterium sp. TaxID=239 RepID=UPI0037BFA589
MSKPLALDLADALISMPIGVSISKIEAAGEELRRLHAANAELALIAKDLISALPSSDELWASGYDKSWIDHCAGVTAKAHEILSKHKGQQG